VRYCFLVMMALIVVQVATVPACKEVYRNWGSELPFVTNWALRVAEDSGYLILLASAFMIVTVASMLYRVSPDSQWRRLAWYIPAAGVAVIFLSLLALFFPMLS